MRLVGADDSSEQSQKPLAQSWYQLQLSWSVNVWDSAALKSLTSSLKAERTARKVYRKRDHVRADVFDYERFGSTTHVSVVNAGTIKFRNNNLEPDALGSLAIGIEELQRRLHGMHALGQVYVGSDCAIEIWRRTPRETCCASVTGLGAARSVAGRAR